MLKLLVRDLDICRVSKLLGRNRLKASITDSTIIVESDEIPDEVIDKLFENATIVGAQNYQTSDIATSGETETIVEEEDDFVDVPLQVAETTESSTENESYEEESIEKFLDKIIDSEYHESTTDLINQDAKNFVSNKQIDKIDMVYRGEVYKWGNIKYYEDREGEVKECVIIIQNDYRMSASEDTIALFCTSHFEERAPIGFSFRLTEANLEDHSLGRLKTYDSCTMFVSHIKGISRNELGAYLGTLNSAFMNTLQPTIDFCLGLRRSRTVNWAQLKILATIDMEEMFAIAKAEISNSKKVTRFLKLFNFDLTLNGMNYVRDAILVAYRLGDYRLEDLAEIIAKQEKVEAQEVLRLIVARIKENFHFKKSPAISFIRLIDKLMKKG